MQKLKRSSINMPHKKSQITLIILIAMVILFAFLGVYFLTIIVSPQRSLEIPFEKGAIEQYMTNCLKAEAENALILMGKQGSFLEPEEYVTSDNYKISILLKSNASLIPRDSVVEEQLSSYIDEHMLSCLQNFRDFEKQGWKVTYETPQTKATLNKKDITFQQLFLISVQKDTAITFKEFTYTAPVRLSYVLEITKKIIDFSILESGYTDLTALAAESVNVTIMPYQGSVLYSIQDEQSRIMNEPYMFNFAIKP